MQASRRSRPEVLLGSPGCPPFLTSGRACTGEKTLRTPGGLRPGLPSHSATVRALVRSSRPRAGGGGRGPGWARAYPEAPSQKGCSP